MDSEFRFVVAMILGAAIVGLMAWFPYHNARQRKHPYSEALGAGCILFVLLCLVIPTNPVLGALPTILWVGLMIWSYTTPARDVRPVGGTMYRDPVPPGFQPTMPVQEEAGTFVVVGVDKASGDDVELKLFAATEANARAKAELKGMVVTRVDRV